jgi:hypothetical protein
VSVVCRQVEVSATSWSLDQRSLTDCGVSKVCDRETSTKRGGPGLYRAVEPYKKNGLNESVIHYASLTRGQSQLSLFIYGSIYDDFSS